MTVALAAKAILYYKMEKAEVFRKKEELYMKTNYHITRDEMREYAKRVNIASKLSLVKIQLNQTRYLITNMMVYTWSLHYTSY